MRLDRSSGVSTATKSPRLKAARDGALITSGVLAASAGFSWVTRTDAMVHTVREAGGTSKYLKNFALGLAVLSAIGAVVNTVLYSVAKKIKDKNPPKAAN